MEKLFHAKQNVEIRGILKRVFTEAEEKESFQTVSRIRSLECSLGVEFLSADLKSNLVEKKSMGLTYRLISGCVHNLGMLLFNTQQQNECAHFLKDLVSPLALYL